MTASHQFKYIDLRTLCVIKARRMFATNQRFQLKDNTSKYSFVIGQTPSRRSEDTQGSKIISITISQFQQAKIIHQRLLITIFHGFVCDPFMWSIITNILMEISNHLK